MQKGVEIMNPTRPQPPRPTSPSPPRPTPPSPPRPTPGPPSPSREQNSADPVRQVFPPRPKKSDD